ncbi:MAG: DUF4142 domain-containing protein [Candidatus Hydrogenedentes bacterium]|nr:DUF4142 domain-containing protein [Candidatus Hydrogenedentota bacterium]
MTRHRIPEMTVLILVCTLAFAAPPGEDQPADQPGADQPSAEQATTQPTEGKTTAQEEGKTSRDESQPLAYGAEKGPLTAEKLLNKLHQDNLAAIKIGQLAASKASSEEVKAFAQKMVQDHQRADAQVKQTAQEQKITLAEKPHEGKHEGKYGEGAEVQAPAPGAKPEGEAKRDKSKAERHAEKMEKLESLSGEEFDREFIMMAQQHHQKCLDLLDHAKKQEDLKAVASLIDKLRPVIQQHAKAAQDLAEKLEIAQEPAQQPEEATRSAAAATK